MKLKRVDVSGEQPSKATGKKRLVSSLTNAKGLATGKKDGTSALVRKKTARAKSADSGAAPSILINLSKLLLDLEGTTISLIEAAPGSGNVENSIIRIDIVVPKTAVNTGPIIFP
jgi:hypothetical protein